MVLPQRLKELYAVAAKAAEHFSPPVDKQRRRVAKAPKLRLPKVEPLSARHVFGRGCGLNLEIPPKKAGNYWCTPEKALTFATTGGDGVHYSYLSSDELPPGVVPVVMTVPMNFTDANVVLAESIDEFLGLGYHVGWFSLEQVVYEPESVPDYFAQPDPDHDEDETARLEFLRSELGIKPVALSLKRIAKLTKRYASFLVVPDEPPD